MRTAPHKKWDELHYLEMTPRQLAEFQATPRPLPSASYAVVAMAVLVVVWRVLAAWGYFV